MKPSAVARLARAPPGAVRPCRAESHLGFSSASSGRDEGGLRGACYSGTRRPAGAARSAFHECGEMAEWLKAHAWKACIGETLSRVRIPVSPPESRGRSRKAEISVRVRPCAAAALAAFSPKWTSAQHGPLPRVFGGNFLRLVSVYDGVGWQARYGSIAVPQADDSPVENRREEKPRGLGSAGLMAPGGARASRATPASGSGQLEE